MSKARKYKDKKTGKITIVTPKGRKLFFPNEKTFSKWYNDFIKRMR